MAFDEELARRVRRVFEANDPVLEKHMFGGIAFMLRGHMCVGIVGDALMVRTGPEANAALLDEPHARPMDFTGRPMRGFLFVDAPGIATAKDLKRWIGHGVAFARSLPKAPKKATPTKSQSPRKAVTGSTRVARRAGK